jgi:hypothetical protein
MQWLGVIGLGRSGKALLTRVFVVGAVRAVAAGSPLVAAAKRTLRNIPIFERGIDISSIVVSRTR